MFRKSTSKKFGLFFRESPPFLLLDDGEHLSTIDKLQNEIQASSVLEIIKEANNEFAFGAKQNVLFIDCVLDLEICE